MTNVKKQESRFKKLWRDAKFKYYPMLRHKAFHLAFDPSYMWMIALPLLIVDAVLNVYIVQNVNYTEIDWNAYMEQVETIVNGTYDYSKIEGGTGPLVYPACHVYVYTIFYYLTNHGRNIRTAQYLFIVVYIVSLSLVFSIYAKSAKVPPFVLVFMCCTSYRIHSIYILRMFNDPIAMMILYAAIYAFINNHWRSGCILYSLAVGVKMNVILYAPALLLILLYANGVKRTLSLIFLCALTQLLLAFPFIVANPFGYISRSFNLSRIFLYVWTVNWRFLPEEIFLSRIFHMTLLILHIGLLASFSIPWIRKFGGTSNLIKWTRTTLLPIPTNLVLLPLLTANFIGISVSRSLHYQFYVWYYHTIPFLLWTVPMSIKARLCLMGLIEMCWNTYPSTELSSIMLHLCHAVILVKLWLSQRKF